MSEREKQLSKALKLALDQYEQICSDHDVMGWPAMVKAGRAVLKNEHGDFESLVEKFTGEVPHER